MASIHGNIDAAAEERDPENFNPSSNLRGEEFSLFPFSSQINRNGVDYDAIDLPVFTCSSRDYVRLKSDPQIFWLLGSLLIPSS